VIAAWLMACGTRGEPEGIGVADHALVRIRGVPAAVITRRAWGDAGSTQVERRTTWRFTTGEREDVDTVAVDDHGRRVDVDGAPYELALAGPMLAEIDGTAVVDAWIGDRVRSTALTRDGDTVTWSAGAAHGAIGLDHGRIAWSSAGPVREEWSNVIPAFDAVDPAALFTAPIGVDGDPRGAIRARFHLSTPPAAFSWQTLTADGVEVTAPLRDEVPRADRDRFTAWIAEARATTSADPAGFGTRGGDCDDQAALVATRAREQGLPAEVAVGVVVEDGALRPHAWVEIQLGSAWIPVDPAFDQPVADAARVTLALDGPDAPWVVLDALNQLRDGAEPSVQLR
jgi:transglutaminase-like putative cysteine protease